MRWILLLSVSLSVSCATATELPTKSKNLFPEFHSCLETNNSFNPLQMCLDRHGQDVKSGYDDRASDMMYCLCDAGKDLQWYARVWLLDVEQFKDLNKTKKDPHRAHIIEDLKKAYVSAADSADDALKANNDYAKQILHLNKNGAPVKDVDMTPMTRAADVLSKRMEILTKNWCVFEHLLADS